MAFGLTRRQRGPDRPYTHSDTWKIKLADPGVEILWSELETSIRRRSVEAPAIGNPFQFMLAGVLEREA